VNGDRRTLSVMRRARLKVGYGRAGLGLGAGGEHRCGCRCEVEAVAVGYLTCVESDVKQPSGERVACRR
jgi:hypothetical protein